MSLSKEILSFLDHLDSTAQSFDADYLEGLFPPDEDLSAVELAEHMHLMKAVAVAASLVMESRTSPMSAPKADIAESLDQVLKGEVDNLLDEHLTRLSLKQVPEEVRRLRRLLVFRAKTMPTKKIINYFRQASTCYVHGLFDAAAALSRSVLEFSLEDALKQKSLEVAPVNGSKGYLQHLIDFSKNTGVLDSTNAPRAHRVRLIGNGVVHRQPTTEAEARESITKTVEVLSHILKAGRA